MPHFKCINLLGMAAAATLFYTAPVFASAVDLNTWTAESYDSVGGFPDGVWTVTGGGVTVDQSQNGQPTFFYSDFNALGTDVQGEIVVSGSDDDYIGFALGFQPNDSLNAFADYLLVDWKRGSQSHDFTSPGPGGLAPAGLAVSRVTGIPTADEFWQHTDYLGDPSGGLQELARGNTLGNTGWVANTSNTFRFVFQATSLQVYVDNVLEIDIAGSFSDGRMAFYNFSQAGVTYSAFTVDPAPVIPEPATMTLLGIGLAGFALRRRKTKV